jgi:hypothetical protein
MTYGTVNVNRVVDASGGVLAPISSVMRNRIINGAMVISQRNGTSSITPTTNGTYALDRWSFYLAQASKFSVQQNAGSVTPPVGFSNYLGVTSLSAYSVTSTDYFFLTQRIEGFNFADLDWGTANAKTVTLSFQVYSSLTGTFSGAITNSAETRSYPFSYTVSAANTWTPVSITIAGDTTGTWIGATNGIGACVDFNLGSGSTRLGTGGAWSASNLLGTTGSVSVVGTNGATFYITGVQLERGTQATSFEYRQYQQELALCQRYYFINRGNGTSGVQVASGVVNATNRVNFIGANLPVSMRTFPSVSVTGCYLYDGSATPNISSLAYTQSTLNSIAFDANASASTLTVGRFCGVGVSPTTDKIEASAEL